jgi:hypothetical protein
MNIALPLQALQQAIIIGHDIGLLVIGIILIVIGIVGPIFTGQNKGWWALVIVGIIVVIVWLIILILGLVV